MKQNYTRFIWVGAIVLATAVVRLCLAADEEFSTLALRPDLKVHSITAPSSASRGASIPVSDVTTNIGNASAGQSKSDIYICTNVDYVTSSFKVASHVVGGMLPGGSFSWAGSVTVPSTQPLGTNYYLVVANGNKQVVESNYANNTNYVMIIINP